jgi:hypothetical protein
VRAPRATVSSLLAGLVACLLAASVASGLFALIAATPGLPLWDMAEHGRDGLRLAEAIRQVRPLAFARELHRQSLWPPLVPLLEAPPFVVLGGDYTVPRHVAAVLCALAVIAIHLAGTSLPLGQRWAAGLTAGVLLALSPRFLALGAEAMLEVPGALLGLLALAAGGRYLADRSTLAWRATWVLTTALFFCKYNYWLVWLAALLAALGLDLRERDPDRFQALAVAVRVHARRPLVRFALVYLAAVAAVAVTGGFEFRIAGLPVSVRGIGNPLFIFLVAISAWAIIALVRNRPASARWWHALGGEARFAIAVTGFPIWAWLVVPPHGKDFFRFLANRPGDQLGPSEGALFYPRVFLHDYSLTPWLGMAVALAAAVGLTLVRSTPAGRLLGLALGAALLANLLHPYKQPRFLGTVAPLVWLACGAAVAGLLARIRPLVAAAAIGAAVIAVALGPLETALGRARGMVEGELVSLAATGVLDEICAAAAAAGERPALLGTWNGLSPALVEWHCRARRPAVAETCLPEAVRDLLPAPTLLDRLARRPGRLVLALEIDPAGPAAGAFTAENSHLAAALAALEADPRFAADSTADAPGSGYRLRCFRVRAAGD